MPWARALRLAKAGEVDLLVATWWTQERTEYLLFSEPYASNDLKFIKRKGDPFEFKGISSLDGKALGVVRSYGYGDQLNSADNYQKVENKDLMTSVKMLLAERLDLTLEDELVARHIINQHDSTMLDQLEFTENVLRSKWLHVSSGLNHPNHQKIITAFNRGLKSMKADGTLQRFVGQLIPLR